MSSTTLTVFFSSAGRRVELLECFREDAARLGITLRAVAGDANPKWSPACSLADAAYTVPPCTSNEFIPAMLELCQQERVDLLVPTIDPELETLAVHAGEFEAQGTIVGISSPDVVRLARDKLQTARVLGQHGIAVPKTAPWNELRAHPDVWNWPVLLKPVNGSSSTGICLLHSPDQMSGFSAGSSQYVAQEFLEGREYTVNVFFSRRGRLESAVPHWRIQVRAGEVSKAVTERHEPLMTIAEKIGAVLASARGPLCFQAIATADRGPVVIEINARFGGGYPLAHRAGARFSQWLLEETAGLPSSCHNSWQSGLAMARYDATHFFSTEGAAS